MLTARTGRRQALTRGGERAAAESGQGRVRRLRSGSCSCQEANHNGNLMYRFPDDFGRPWSACAAGTPSGSQRLPAQLQDDRSACASPAESCASMRGLERRDLRPQPVEQSAPGRRSARSPGAAGRRGRGAARSGRGRAARSPCRPCSAPVTKECRARCAAVRSGCRSSTVSAVYCSAVRPTGRVRSSSSARTASSTCFIRYSRVGRGGATRRSLGPSLPSSDWRRASHRRGVR